MRRKTVFLIAVAAFTAQFALAADLNVAFDDVAQLDLTPMAALFNRNSEPVTSANGMISFAPPAANVFVARKTSDGQLVTGCVDNELALRRFLERKTDDVPSTTPAEK